MIAEGSQEYLKQRLPAISVQRSADFRSEVRSKEFLKSLNLYEYDFIYIREFMTNNQLENDQFLHDQRYKKTRMSSLEYKMHR